MQFFTLKTGRYTLGIWMAIVAILLTFLAWIMQFYSLINWEGALELGLQNESFNGTPVERAYADVERGVALADMVWALPLTLIAFIGILKKRMIGLVAGMMDFAICVISSWFLPSIDGIHTG